MSHSIAKPWRTLVHGKPGRRFNDWHDAQKQARESRDWSQRALRLLRLIGALAAFVVGVFLTFLPGPAIVFFFLAGGLLAAESVFVARILDWLEVKLRVVWNWGRRHWHRLPWFGKAAVACAAACGSLGCAYLSYRLMAG